MPRSLVREPPWVASPVRLGQLTGLLHARPALFDALLTAQSVAALREFFQAPAPDYWRTHFRPGRAGQHRLVFGDQGGGGGIHGLP